MSVFVYSLDLNVANIGRTIITLFYFFFRPEDGEVYEGRDYYSSQLGQYNTGYTEEYQRGRPRDRFPPRGGGFKQFDR